MIEPDQYARQNQLVPAKRLAEVGAITVIGIGAVGRQVAIQLAAMGAPEITLIDPDQVERVNLPTQGWRLVQLGMLKVQATHYDIAELAPDCQVNTYARRCEPLDDLQDRGPVFCCVDTIRDRSHIWSNGGRQASIWIDGRTGAEAIRILAASDQLDTRTHYASSLFPQDEQHGGGCTTQATIYVGNVAAGMMLAQFARWLRRQEHEAEISLSLLASELHVFDARQPSPAGA